MRRFRLLILRQKDTAVSAGVGETQDEVLDLMQRASRVVPDLLSTCLGAEVPVSRKVWGELL